MTKMEYKQGNELTYAFCDDWLIYARDKRGKLFFVITEMWHEWLNLPENADQEPNAVEKYMLPVAQQKWDDLIFERYLDLDEVFRAVNVTTCEIVESDCLKPVYKVAYSWRRQGHEVDLSKGWKDSSIIRDGQRVTEYVPCKQLPILT